MVLTEEGQRMFRRAVVGRCGDRLAEHVAVDRADSDRVGDCC